MFALKTGSRLSRAAVNPAKRFNHGVHYGPEEPLTPYLKWVAAVSACVGLVTYDRFLSDQSISARVTPKSDPAAQREETFKVVEEQWAAQERPIAFFDSAKRNTHLTNFGVNPVPEGGQRAEHTNHTLDLSDIPERRSRSKVQD